MRNVQQDPYPDDTPNAFAPAVADRPVLAGRRFCRAREGGDHRAGLVIRYADGSVQTQCVAFSEASITGEELLQRSGLAVTLDYNAGLGGAVCSINNQGARTPSRIASANARESCVSTGLITIGRLPAGTTLRPAPAATRSPTAHWKAGRGEQGTCPPGSNRRRGIRRCLCGSGNGHADRNATATPTATATATPTSTVRPPQDQNPPQVTFEAQGYRV